MLVLTRKAEEKIQIGDNIVVTVLRLKGNAVSIGIEAPRDVRVVRSELSPPAVAATTDVSVAPSRLERNAPLATILAGVKVFS
jgi:carbon storage regulator CsrA